jgi:DNA end-binding protein Ku
MVEAVWNGFLRLSLVSCPISLSPAISDANSIRLDPLSARSGNPVTQQYVDARTGDVVAADALVKGYEVEASRYVTIGEDELEKLGAGANVIELEHFVPRDQIDPIYIETTYYLHPDGPHASDTVHALRLAMRRSKRVALGHVWIGQRERPALIEPYRDGLMVSTLHTEEEYVPAQFAAPPEDQIPVEAVEIAEAIIARRSSDFNPGQLRDRFQHGLRALLEEKSRNVPRGRTRPPPPPAPSRTAEPPPPASPSVEASPAPAEAEPPPPEPEPAPVTAAPPPEPAEPAPVIAAPPPPVVEAPPPPVVEAPPPPVVEASPPEPEPEPVPAAAAAPPPSEPEPVPELAAAPGTGPHDVGAEILLHIMGLGDRRYVEPGWAGNPGSRRQVEALSIRPRDALTASAIEFRVFAQEGRATAWVTNGNYAGTRGRDLPLTGFAIRPAGDFGDRLDITYEGSFFEGGVIGPKRNGELCISTVADDPLEAIRVAIIDRGSE